jgi:hypothetical protein
MDNQVNRDKYEAIKKKAEQWREYAINYKNKNEQICEELESLKLENDELLNKIVNCDNSLLENENRDLRKSLRILKKKICSIEEKSSKEHFTFENKLMLKDLEIQSLKSALLDSREQFKEFKEEYKEFRREFNRSVKSDV